MDIKQQVNSWFSAHGPLAATVGDYRPRQGQIEMAQAVYQAIANQNHLVIEAGTGTGKTFAYLLPVLHSGRKTIVSTGTRNLQDQLFHRDIPIVTAAFGQPVKIALLKGRSNYLCLYRLGQIATITDSKFSQRHLQTIVQWSYRTQVGDIAEVSEVAENALIWPWVTSTADNCLGQECPQFSDCHVVKARRKAQGADIVVVNHHLLLADFRLKDEGFGELLPGVDVVVLDEAHQFPDVAANFFGQRISARQINGLVKDAISESFAVGMDREAIDTHIQKLKEITAALRQAMGNGSSRINLDEADHAVADRMADLASALLGFEQCLLQADGASSGLDSCCRRAHDAAQTLLSMRDRNNTGSVSWIEATQGGFVLQQAPLDVSRHISGLLKEPRSWIFTSATLAVREDFSHFVARVGLRVAPDIDVSMTQPVNQPMTIQVQSHFDYVNNAMLLIPEQMPEPSAKDYTDRVVELGIQLLEHLNGGAFFLFTSYRALKRVRQLLEQAQTRNDDLGKRVILAQGELPRDELLRQFRDDGHAVLLGTNSFWEGVDVRGSALRMVLIDKLPFASPGDPLLQARLNAIKQMGGNPFIDFQLPSAVLALKQGVGRLIRDGNDWGICVLCDPRVFTKGYGKTILASLPPMPVVTSTAGAISFLNKNERLP